MVIKWFKRQLGLIVEIPRGWELMQLPAERIAELRAGYPVGRRDKPLSSCPAYLDVDLFARAVWPPLDGKYRVYLVREGGDLPRSDDQPLPSEFTRAVEVLDAVAERGLAALYEPQVMALLRMHSPQMREAINTGITALVKAGVVQDWRHGWWRRR